MVNYKSIDLNGRIQMAFSQAKTAGINADKARSLIAVSVREADAIWTENRETGGPLRAMDSCWPGRVVVGFESRSGKYGRRFDDAWVADAEALAFLQNSGLGILKDDGEVYPTVTKGDDNREAALFEWVVGRRKARLLADFSLGPTQMYMWYSQMSVDSGAGPSVANTGWPKSWEEMASFYTETDAGALMKRINYLDPGVNPYASSWPSEHPDDDTTNMAWLRNQVGPNDPSFLDTYYHTYFKKNLIKTIGLTSS